MAHSVHRQISQDCILYCPTVEIIHLFNLHCNMALTHSHLAIAEPLCYMWLQIDRHSLHTACMVMVVSKSPVLVY